MDIFDNIINNEETGSNKPNKHPENGFDKSMFESPAEFKKFLKMLSDIKTSKHDLDKLIDNNDILKKRVEMQQAQFQLDLWIHDTFARGDIGTIMDSVNLSHEEYYDEDKIGVFYKIPSMILGRLGIGTNNGLWMAISKAELRPMMMNLN